MTLTYASLGKIAPWDTLFYVIAQVAGGIAGVLVPWHLYEWYGDKAVLRDSFESARRYIDYLSSTAKDGIITSNLGDWYDFGHGKGNGPSRWTPNEVSATAIWALGADTLARSAEVLGRESGQRRRHLDADAGARRQSQASAGKTRLGARALLLPRKLGQHRPAQAGLTRLVETYRTSILSSLDVCYAPQTGRTRA